MDKINREIQRELLQFLYSIYPARPKTFSLDHFIEKFGGIENYNANVVYLSEHGLIKATIRRVVSSRMPEIQDSSTTITAKGIDFILQDGGLSAILNVQTIKFHKDAVVALEDLIAISNMSDAEKEKAKSTLGEMSTEALKAVVSTVTATGLSMLLGK